MPVDRDIQLLMPHTVTIATSPTVNNYGERSFGAGTNYTARVVKKIQWIRDINGDMKKSFGVVYVDRVSGITPNDRITLPDGTTPPVLRVDTIPDEMGNYYEQVYLGYAG